MAQFETTAPRRGSGALIPAALTLAWWRLRQTWRLLGLTGLGVLAAVVLICTVPLFSQVATSAGLRNVLNALPSDSEFAITGYSGRPTIDSTASADRQVKDLVTQSFGSMVTNDPVFSIVVRHFLLVDAKSGLNGDSLDLRGYAIAQTLPHVQLVQGRLPVETGTTPEIAITQATADRLNARVGSDLVISKNPNAGTSNGTVSASDVLKLRVVGIFAPVTVTDEYWHGQVFDPMAQGPTTGYTGLASNTALLAELTAAAATVSTSQNSVQQVAELTWFYHFDTAHINSVDLDKLGAIVQKFSQQANNVFSNLPNFFGGSVNGQGFETLLGFSQRVGYLQIPVTILLLQILGLVIFFVSITAEMLIDRQTDAISVLRSRGAKRRQIFGALATQTFGVGITALIVGPLIAIPLVGLIAQHLLSASDQGALDVITSDPLRVAFSVRWYAIIAVVSAVVAMLLAINRAAGLDVLSARRESARSTRKPLWQRMNLDIVAAIVGLTGYGAYSLAEHQIGNQVGFVLVLTPLALIAPTFLLVSISLIFMRIFPLLTQFGTRLATRGSGAAPMLALAQMSRSPKQSQRTTLLLALATAFTIFALIFIASQGQRTIDVANFNVGADFMGVLPSGTSASQPKLTDQTAIYRAIAGVNAASLGYTTDVQPRDQGPGLLLSVVAVDADTYADAALWSAVNATQPVTSIMADLAQQRTSAITADVVPAYLPATTWDALALTPGTHFSLSVTGYSTGVMHLIAAGKISHIPGIYDSASVNGGNGGMLVDYQTYAAVYAKDLPGTTIAPNAVWLRSASDAASLTTIRTALSKGPLKLNTFLDRRAMIQEAQANPLQLELSGVLGIGAAAALLLALIGALISSWLSARSRLVNFSVLRALGTTPAQIASVLLWEQSIIYGTAVILGVGLGALLASIVLPVMVFTNLLQGSRFNEIALNVPPVAITVPGSALALVIAGVIAVCAFVIALMTRIVARPSISQTLRLNED